MLREPLDNLVEQQKGWLDPIGRALVDGMKWIRNNGGKAAQQGLDFAHGVWLGHPLHPVLTDMPVGAWTVAVTLDAVNSVSPSEPVRRCADAALGLGVAAAVPTALAGVADWYHLVGHTRRMGLTHALLNVGAVVLNTASLLLRGGKRRQIGVGLSMVSYAALALSAYIGGELVYATGVGVDHTTFEPKLPSKRFTPVMPEADLEENKPHRVVVNGTPVMLVRRHGHIHAIGETCTHLGGPLAKGTLEDEAVVCPWHQSRFALKDGAIVSGPATFPEQAYEVRVNEGQIEVRAL